MALKEDSLSPDARVLHEAEKLAIILGTEGEGLAADTIADCDYTVCIPMARGVDSLNVAAPVQWHFGNYADKSDFNLKC